MMPRKTLTLGALALAGMLNAMPAPALAATPAEEANRKLVLDFYAALNQADADGRSKQQIVAIAEKYLAPDYLQHNARMASFGPGRDGFIKLFQNMPPMPRSPAMATQTTVAVLAEGDKVMLLTSRGGAPESAPPAGTPPDGISYMFNLFRVKDGKLAEHWDAGSMPPAGGPK